MAEIHLEKKEKLDLVYSIIHLRGSAVVLALLPGIAAALATAAYLPLLLGTSLALAVLFSNTAGYLYLKNRELFLNPGQIVIICFLQILIDLTAITLLIHVTGGILSPFAPLYLYAIIVMGLAAPEKPSLAQAAGLFIIFLYESLLALEFYGLIHPFILIQQGREVYQDIKLILSYLLLFPIPVIITIFLSTQHARRLLRGKGALYERIAELNGARKHLEAALGDLERKTSEVSILYEIAAREVFPLDRFISRLAEMFQAEVLEISVFEAGGKARTVAAYGFPAPAAPPAAELRLPLQRGKENIGGLKLIRFTGKEFSADEKRLLTIIADRLAREIARQQEESHRLRLEEELKAKLAELEEFHNLAVGRELRMIELEKEIEALKRQRGIKR